MPSEALAALDFDATLLEIGIRLAAALGVGALIGFERSYRGRPAGFRTHALVCLSTSLLMLLTAYEERWVRVASGVTFTLDPTRMAQGIMTGIGFLGAGAIMRDGLTVRGLTTAASIWITAAIGILIGIGFYEPAMISAFLTLFVLSVFQRIEHRMPSQFYAHFTLRFAREAAMPEPQLRELVTKHGFSIANLNYRLDADHAFVEYGMVIRSARAANAAKLCETLNTLPAVREYRLSPTGD
ncbi:MAG TPA: MgtC/SapB family protein [Planctomycetota bacterium]|nr:MgtC/SapB family protein [Planctomycetota bacterium]